MKKTLILSALTVLCLVSCHKKYEEKAGTFSGYEVYIRVPYDDQNDTLDFDIVAANYTLTYNKNNKSYSVTSSTGNISNIQFDRDDFKDNQAESGSVLSFSTWYVSLEGNSFTATYEDFDFNELEAWSFEGDKN